MQGIILAAGSGTRLRPLTENIPKPLVKVGGRPMLDYAIALLRSLGITDITIVGGYRFSDMKKYVDSLNDENIRVVENKEYEKDSLTSLSTALSLVDGQFFQIDVDFIYTWDLMERIKEQIGGESIKVISTSVKSDVPPDMVKVSVDGSGHVAEMAKELKDFQYGYVGMFYCPEKYVASLKESADILLKGTTKEKGEKVWSALPQLAKKMEWELVVGDIGGFEAVEIDTEEELKEAEEFVRQNQDSVKHYFMV